MKQFLFIVGLFLLLSFEHAKAQSSCVQSQDFENCSFSDLGFEFSNTGSNHGECEDDIDNLNSLSANNISCISYNLYTDTVTLVNTGFDPIISNLPRVKPITTGNSVGLRINPRNSNITNGLEKNITILTKEFNNITEDFITFDFSVLFQSPDHDDQLPFVYFSVTNNSGNETYISYCLKSDGDNNHPLTSTIVNMEEWLFSGWENHSFNVSNYIGQNITLKIIASDCGIAAHDTILYLDNICNSDTSVGTVSSPGSITLDDIVLSDCTTDPFTVCGTYTLPTGFNNVDISLSALPNGFPLEVIADPENFSGGTFCFTINPLTDFACQTCTYTTIIANADFSSGSSVISESDSELIFLDLTDLSGCVDPCEPIEAIVDGTILQWPDTSDTYDLEFVLDSNCCPESNHSNEGQSFSINNYDTNSINILQDILLDSPFNNNNGFFSKCFRFRIKPSCGEIWSDWCCVDQDPNNNGEYINPYNQCYPNNPCEDNEPLLELFNTIDDNVVANTTENYSGYVNIKASNIIEANSSSTVVASESIRLLPDFHARDDSYYNAYIEECFDIIIPPSNRITQLQNDIIKVFPNPAKTVLNISIEKTKLSSIELFNIYGKSIQSFENLNTFKHQLNVDRLSRGYYVVKVVLEDGTTQLKNIILK